MSFSLNSPNLHVWDNAAFDDAAADFVGSKNWVPLQPISINLSRLTKLHPDKLLVPAKSTKKPGEQYIGAIAVDGDIEAEIEETEKEIRRLLARLEALHMKKADRDLRAAAAKPFVTKNAVTVCKKKAADFSVDSSISSYRRRGLSLGPSEKGRNPRKRISSEIRKGIATVGAKKLVKTENANFGSLKPKTLFLERQNPVTGEKPLKNDKVRVVASRYGLRSRETESKRRKWSLPEPAEVKIGRTESKRFLSFEESNGSEA